jgi:hypothetical protein
MSGEITITPGYEFDNEPVTLDKLNQLGNPMARVGESSIGSRELDVEELQSVVGTSFNNLNFLVAGNFEEPSWLSGAGPITCPAAVKTFVNSTFQVAPSGAGVTGLRTLTVPNTASLHGLRVDGAATVTEVEVLQELRRYISAGMRRMLTFSAWVFNGTGAELVPLLRLNTANAPDVFSAVTNRSSATLQACANGVWTRVFVSVDATAFADMTNGLQVALRFPSGSLNSVGKYVILSQLKLELGDVATPLSPAPGVVLGAASVLAENLAANAVVTDKILDGNVTLSKVAAAVLAAVRDRATHTGTQPAVSISDFAAQALAEVTWASLTGKPSVFSPAAHTHGAADLPPSRALLTADRTYFVRTDGNDVNTGLVNNAGGAFLTVQRALTVISTTLDLGQFNVTIQIADGTYTGQVNCLPYVKGAGQVTVLGNAATPSNVVLTSTAEATFRNASGCHYNLSGVEVRRTSAQAYWGCVTADGAGSVINITGPVAVQGTSGGACFCSLFGGSILSNQNITMTGAASGSFSFFLSSEGGGINIYGGTLALGTRTFSRTARVRDCSVMYMSGVTWTGTVTATRYDVERNGVLQTFGAGVNFIPGNVAGTTATGGVYA